MTKDITGLRIEYRASGLMEEDLLPDPVDFFDAWFQESMQTDTGLANAMVLATADRDGRPSARFVLLKEYGKEGFVFYTNSLSRKGRELAENPHAALVFYWHHLYRQVRVEGLIEQLPADKADMYFETRPLASRVSAWVAIQSQIIPGRDYLSNKVAELTRRFVDRPVPRPETWLGYRVRHESVEFWQGQENRLHDRIIYKRDEKGNWVTGRLAP